MGSAVVKHMCTYLHAHIHAHLQWDFLRNIEDEYDQVDSFIDNGGRAVVKHDDFPKTKREQTKAGLQEAVST